MTSARPFARSSSRSRNAQSSTSPVGLDGEVRKTSLMRGSAARISTAPCSSREKSSVKRGTEPRPHPGSVPQSGTCRKRADSSGWHPRQRSRNTGQQVDALVAAPRNRQLVLAGLVKPGRAPKQASVAGPGSGSDGCPDPAGPGCFVGVGRMPSSSFPCAPRNTVSWPRFQAAQFFDTHDYSPRADRHAVGFQAFDLGQLLRAGPTVARASRLAFCRVMRRMKSPVPSAPWERDQP